SGAARQRAREGAARARLWKPRRPPGERTDTPVKAPYAGQTQQSLPQAPGRTAVEERKIVLQTEAVALRLIEIVPRLIEVVLQPGEVALQPDVLVLQPVAVGAEGLQLALGAGGPAAQIGGGGLGLLHRVPWH